MVSLRDDFTSGGPGSIFRVIVMKEPKENSVGTPLPGCPYTDCQKTPSLPSEGHPRVASLALRAIHLQVARRSRVGGVGAKSLECVRNNGHFPISNLPPLSQLR